MRIISGKYKGRQIQSSRDRSIRPTTNKIKEYIFELLGDAVHDALVLDLFSGSGSLGIEAVSRGARGITFVDVSQNSLRVLRKNLENLKIAEPVYTVKRDVIQFLKKNRQPFDLIFADPPFKWAKFDDMLPLIFKPEVLSDNGIFVLESEKSHDIDWTQEIFTVRRQKIFDRSVITFLARNDQI